jgi:hypothetical protein
VPIPFLDWLTGKQKPLSKMSRQELRRQELLLEKHRGMLLKRMERLTREKQGLFERGAREKSVEVRRTYAQEFEMKTTEQLMLSRQLNIRSKEMLTVSRLRMLRENAERAKLTGGRVGLIGQKDLIRLGRLIENDAVTTDMYQERLDDILALGSEVDEGRAGVSEAGESVMNIWSKMDHGLIEDQAEAFDEADRRVREQQSAAAEE